MEALSWFCSHRSTVVSPTSTAPEPTSPSPSAGGADGADGGTQLLNQAVVCAVEGHVDADEPRGFGAQPGDQAPALLLGAALGRVVGAQHHLPAALRLLVVHPAAEGLGVLGGEHALALQVELHRFHRRDQADRHVAHAGAVVAEVDSQSSVAVVHYPAHDQQVQFDSFDVGVEVPPEEGPGEPGGSVALADGPQLDL